MREEGPGSAPEAAIHTPVIADFLPSQVVGYIVLVVDDHPCGQRNHIAGPEYGQAVDTQAAHDYGANDKIEKFVDP